MIAPLLLLAASAASAATLPAAAPHAKPYWLKVYAPPPYQELWRVDLAVKKLDDATPKVVAAVEKSGGRLTQPLAAFIASATERQLSLIVPQDKAAGLLKSLRKLGKAADPAVRSGGQPIPLGEVREKLARLTKEKTEKKDALAQTPAAAEAVDEMIEHLSGAERAASAASRDVLWNITVREER